MRDMQPQIPPIPSQNPQAGTEPVLPEVPQQPLAPQQAAPAPLAPFTAPVGQAAPQSSQAATPATPALADDGDLIEKEWVSQVKRIIATTAHDPFEQNKQLTKLKADYMQKRYGKVIKLED